MKQTKNYELFYAKQTQFSEQPNEHKPNYDKALRQFPSPRTLQKQSQNKPNSNPIKPNSKPISEKPK